VLGTTANVPVVAFSIVLTQRALVLFSEICEKELLLSCLKKAASKLAEQHKHQLFGVRKITSKHVYPQ